MTFLLFEDNYIIIPKFDNSYSQKFDLNSVVEAPSIFFKGVIKNFILNKIWYKKKKNCEYIFKSLHDSSL